MVKKERQRYIYFRIIKEHDVNFEKQDLLRAIWHSIWRYFGLKESLKIGLWLVELNIEQGFGIIRCTHTTKEIIVSSLALIKDINGRKVILSPVRTSGTIKGLQPFIS